MKNKISLLALVILIFSTTVGYTDPLSSMDHDFNPALMNVRNRRFLEVGTKANFGFGNNYFGLGDLLIDELQIDLNDMSSQLGDTGLVFASGLQSGGHAVVSLPFKLSLGYFSELDMISSFNTPGALFEVLGEGISATDSIKDTSNIYSRVFYEAGLFAGYRMDDIQIGVKMASFTPLVYTTGKIDYTYTSDQSTGDINANLNMSIPVYSALNFDTMGDDQAQVTEALFGNPNAGFKIDIGAVKVRNKKPMYGVSLTGLALSPAVAQYKNEIIGGPTISATNLAETIENDDPFNSSGDVDIISTSGSYEIRTPLSLGGFYRLGLPLVDLIGETELTFDDPFLFKMAVDAEGNIWPLSWFNAGLGWNKVNWEAYLGTRINLRLLEIGAEFGMASPGLQTLFSSSGMTLGIFVAMGL